MAAGFVVPPFSGKTKILTLLSIKRGLTADTYPPNANAGNSHFPVRDRLDAARMAACRCQHGNVRIDRVLHGVNQPVLEGAIIRAASRRHAVPLVILSTPAGLLFNGSSRWLSEEKQAQSTAPI